MLVFHSCLHFRDLLQSLAVWWEPRNHPVQQSGSRIPQTASLHLSRWEWYRVCKVTVNQVFNRVAMFRISSDDQQVAVISF